MERRGRDVGVPRRRRRRRTSGGRSKRLLAPGDVVAGVEFVSKDEALARFKQTFGDLAATIDGARRQPVAGVVRGAAAAGPGASARRRRAGRAAAADAGRRRRALRPAVARPLLSAIARRSAASAWCSARVLTLAAALTVANVVRLALYARRDEIEIMQLVGAPQAYIRGPFVMEGVLQGGHRRAAGAGRAGVAFFALRGALPGAAGGGDEPVVGPVSVARAVLSRAGGRAGWWSGAWAGWWPPDGPELRSVTES